MNEIIRRVHRNDGRTRLLCQPTMRLQKFLLAVNIDELVYRRNVNGFVNSPQARRANSEKWGVLFWVRCNDEECSATQHPNFFEVVKYYRADILFWTFYEIINFKYQIQRNLSPPPPSRRGQERGYYVYLLNWCSEVRGGNGYFLTHIMVLDTARNKW